MVHKYHYWWSSSWGHKNEGSFRYLNTKDTWTRFKGYSNLIFECTMWKNSSRRSKWMLGSPNLESGRKSYASGKITDTTLPGRPALHLPKTTPGYHHTLGDSPMDPQTLGRHAQSEAKAGRPPDMLPQMGSWSGHLKLGSLCKVGSAPTCKETGKHLGRPRQRWCQMVKVLGWPACYLHATWPPSRGCYLNLRTYLQDKQHSVHRPWRPIKGSPHLHAKHRALKQGQGEA
jgi:hypothetical protein